MVDRNRKKVWQTVNYGVDLEYIKVTDVIKQLKDYVDEYGEDIRFELEYSDPYGDSDRQYLVITKEVDETDEQMKNRIAQEEYREKSRLDRDRQDYERLKKQFGE